MQDFARLFHQLDATTAAASRIEAITDYLAATDDRSALHAIALMVGKRPKRVVTARRLQDWAIEMTGIPTWLFEDGYQRVGDLAETVSLILPPQSAGIPKPLHWWMDFLIDLRASKLEDRRPRIIQAWQELGQEELYVFCKLLAGGWRLGVPRKLLTKAIALYSGRDISMVAHRLQSDWNPFEMTLSQLLEKSEEDENSQPYPLQLAAPLENEPEEMGEIGEWSAELKWEGIRGQLIYRGGELYVWDRREELVTDKFPEYHEFKHSLPEGTVIDGEMLCFHEGEPLPLHLLENRISRKTIGKKTLEQSPAVLMAFDLLEYKGEDIRQRPFHLRRVLLEEIVAQVDHPALLLSDAVEGESWQELRELWEDARLMKCSGLVLKRKDSIYRSGGEQQDWWTWKVKPFKVNAVLIYATRGLGGQAGLYSDYTFAVWNGDQLVPLTKASEGLTEEEAADIAMFIKENTVERFGPVQSIKPKIVMEITFEGIARSSRHKSGVALRSARIHRIRRDIPSGNANTIHDLLAILESIGQ